MLVTDYSSVFFDFANLKKPIIFYMYDYEFYKDELRGFYFDIDTLPGEIVKTDNDLIEEIFKSKTSFKIDERYQIFCDKYNYLDDGNATKRVVHKIFKDIK